MTPETTADQTANQRLTRQGILEAHRDEVIAAIANNVPWSVIMPRYGVAKPSFAAFVKRHRDEIEALKAKARGRVEDVALKDKEARIRNYDGMIARIEQLIEQRGGLEAVDYKGLGQGENFEIRVVRRFDTGLVSEWRNLHRAIADELGDIPRPSDVTVNIDQRQIVLRWDDGSPARGQDG